MLPIGKGNHGKYKINFTSGKKAITSFKVIDSKDSFSLIQAQLYTGRTHQIRIHLKALNAPLYKDFLYGKNSNDKKLTLFSNYLQIIHPKSNQIITFSAEISQFMKENIDLLGLSLRNMVSNKNDTY